jgi:hypothetical protein
MANELHYQILAGLPGEGPLPLQFSATGQGLHSEGFVVLFSVEGLPSWVGNFQPGFSKFNCVLNGDSAFNLTVVAGGQGYVVDLRNGALIKYFGGDVEYMVDIPELEATLISNGIWLQLLNAGAEIWCTERLSLDGIQDIFISVEDGVITGQGWYLEDAWYPFEVDLSSGKARGDAFELADL